MSRSRGRLVPVLLATLVLLAGANLASYAASGGPLLAGKGNKATKTTKLKNTGAGPALALTSKPGTAPLAVSDSTKVANLNADLVDGLDSAQLRNADTVDGLDSTQLRNADTVDGLDSTQLRNADTVDGLDSAALTNKTYVYSLSGSTTSGNLGFPLAGLPAGKYLASYAVAAAFTSVPTHFACYFTSTTGSISKFSIISAAALDGTGLYTSGSGFLDTTTTPMMLACEKNGGGTMTMPTPLGSFPSQVTLTRLDDVTQGTSTGAPFTLTARPGPATLQR